MPFFMKTQIQNKTVVTGQLASVLCAPAGDKAQATRPGFFFVVVVG